MTGIGFLILSCLSCVLLPCEGQQINLPADGKILTFLKGSTARIEWSYTGVTNVRLRSWFFTSSNGEFNNKLLAEISRDENATIETRELEVNVIKPATLVLKNVNITYNGNYRFQVIPGGLDSEVFVFIAVVPTVSFSCSSPITVNEGDNVTCVCRGQGGNPPADVSWYKHGAMIGTTGKEEKSLTLTKVDKTASGTYKCAAKSHTVTDEKSIEIIVYYAVPPTVISLTSTPENAVFGESVVITCEAIAVPLPRYTIIHNDTEIVSTQKTYIISVLEYSHSGLYKCIATSILGNSSKIFNLSITETRTTNAPTTENFRTGTTALEETNCSGTEWYIVLVSLVSGITIGIILSYIISCYCRKLKSRNPQLNPEPRANEVDTTYQELDLTKMNKEDNYQSLRVNAASIDAGNDDDSTYTELKKNRDVQNNYQSLTA